MFNITNISYKNIAIHVIFSDLHQKSGEMMVILRGFLFFLSALSTPFKGKINFINYQFVNIVLPVIDVICMSFIIKACRKTRQALIILSD